MPTDEERRAVAARLREIDAERLDRVYGMDGEDGECEDPGVANTGRDLMLGAIAEAVGMHFAPYYFDAAPLRDRLADLIEPSCDRERLLAIATMMAADSVRSVKQGSSVSPVYILHAARNIAEACGETFGSIRNRELAKWGTSIVPKETIVDRDALLRLARYMDKDVAETEAHFSNVISTKSVSDYARRIREACGEGEA